MKPFEYVLVIISLVIGLAFTEFANSVAYLISNHKISVISWSWLAIMFAGLLIGLNYWGSIYSLRKVDEWNILKVGLPFFSGLTYFTSARILIPDPNNFDHNYQRFFDDKISTVFAITICFIVLLLIETFTIRKGRTLKSYIIMTLFILLLISGIVIENNSYREALAFILLALQIINVVAITRAVITDK